MFDSAPQNPKNLTRLRLRVVQSESGARTLTVYFLVNPQQLLLEDFDAAAHDAALEVAHANGHMPTSIPMVSTGPAESEQLGITCELCQGKGWLFEQDEQDCPDCEGGKIKPSGPRWGSIQDLEIENAIMSGDLAQVAVSMMLGPSL